MIELAILLRHDIVQFFGEILGIVDEINRHEICGPCLYLFLSQLPLCFLLFFLNLFLFVLGFLCDSLFEADVGRIGEVIILFIAVGEFFERLSGDIQEVCSNHPHFGRLTEAPLGDNIHTLIVSPYIPFIQVNHQFD